MAKYIVYVSRTGSAVVEATSVSEAIDIVDEMNPYDPCDFEWDDEVDVIDAFRKPE